MTPPIRLSLLASLLFATTGKADDKAHLIFDDFENRTELGEEYHTGSDGNGAWTVRDGILVGKKTREEHGAVIRRDLDFGDIEIGLDFRFNGSKRFNLVIDDKSEKSVHAGHICRVSITPKHLTVGDDKTGTMNLKIREMRKSKTLSSDEKEELEEVLKKSRITVPNDLEVGEWYKLRVTIVGDLMTAYVDGKKIAKLRSPGIAHPTKSKFGMTVTGTSIDFDNFRASQVE